MAENDDVATSTETRSLHQSRRVSSVNSSAPGLALVPRERARTRVTALAMAFSRLKCTTARSPMRRFDHLRAGEGGVNGGGL